GPWPNARRCLARKHERRQRTSFAAVAGRIGQAAGLRPADRYGAAREGGSGAHQQATPSTAFKLVAGAHFTAAGDSTLAMLFLGLFAGLEPADDERSYGRSVRQWPTGVLMSFASSAGDRAR